MLRLHPELLDNFSIKEKKQQVIIKDYCDEGSKTVYGPFESIEAAMKWAADDYKKELPTYASPRYSVCPLMEPK